MTPGIQVAKPNAAVEGQITLEMIPAINAANGPPREPKRMPSDGFSMTAADGPYGINGIAARIMSRAAREQTSATSLLNGTFFSCNAMTSLLESFVLFYHLSAELANIVSLGNVASNQRDMEASSGRNQLHCLLK